MTSLILLKNNLSDLIQLLLTINEKFSVSNSRIDVSTSKLQDDIIQSELELTPSYHVERLKISRDFLTQTYKTENFNQKINYYSLKKLLYTVKSMLDMTYKNAESLHSSIGSINELNSKVLKTAIYKEDRIICNTSAKNPKLIIIEYNLLELFEKNELLIKNLITCLSEIFITYDLNNIIQSQNKIKPYVENGNIDFIYSLFENKEEYRTLLFELLENKKELDEFQTKQINFSKVIEQYQAAKENLDLRFKDVNKLLNESSKELNTFQEMSLFLDSEYNRLKENKDSIDNALNSIDEINKIGDESKEIVTFMNSKKKAISDILTDAKNTIKILSGSSIAKHLNKQEEKENDAAFGWLILSGVILLTSLFLVIYTYYNKGLTWESFILKILTLPILFSSLIFAMRQYVKRKNIADSYAYKKTLALSLTGFKKQIDKSVNDEEQTDYVLKTIEILTESPLNGLDKNHIKNDLDALEKMRESVIDNVISTIKSQSLDKKEKKQSTSD